MGQPGSIDQACRPPTPLPSCLPAGSGHCGPVVAWVGEVSTGSVCAFLWPEA